MEKDLLKYKNLIAADRQKYLRVTEVIRACRGGDAIEGLLKWASEIGPGFKDRRELAAQFGSLAHRIIADRVYPPRRYKELQAKDLQALVNFDGLLNFSATVAIDMVSSWLDANINFDRFGPIVERNVYSDRLLVAGTLDYIIPTDNYGTLLLDLKFTSTARSMREQKLQLKFYDMLRLEMSELQNIEIDNYANLFFDTKNKKVVFEIVDKNEISENEIELMSMLAWERKSIRP